MKLQNYYTLLQVLPQASTEEIKKAYRKLAKVWHPDKNQSLTAAKVFQGIHEAYKTLTNPIKRKSYNLKYWKVFGKTAAQTTQKEETETYFSADDILRKNCDRMMRKSSKKSAQVYQDWLNNFWASWEVTPST